MMQLPSSSGGGRPGTPSLAPITAIGGITENSEFDIVPPQPAPQCLESLRRLSPLPFDVSSDPNRLSFTSFDYNAFCDFGLIDNDAMTDTPGTHDTKQPLLTLEEHDLADVHDMNELYPPYQDFFPETTMSTSCLTFNGEDICHSPVTKRAEA